MKKLLYLVPLLLFINLYAYNDSDMDGIEDQFDQCANTPFTELADKKGCTQKSPHLFNILFGLSSSNTNYDNSEKTDTTTKSVQLNYKYNNISVHTSISYFESKSDTYDESGMNDTFVGINYKLKSTNKLSTTLGFGLILPTYDSTLNNNNMDYSLSAGLNYKYNNTDIFGGYSYTIINDDDVVNTTSYKNTNGYNIGAGYSPTQKTYFSTSYNQSNSVYNNVNDIKTLSLFGVYSIDTKWFTNFNYTHGLSDTASDKYITLRIGYNF
ncbi:DUF3187 family protein [Arcobacteraceae bacterium]|nr:DUF3187 family protein [Arcobacteraceae bacterium]